MTAPKWKFDGVRVVHSSELDGNTPQTPVNLDIPAVEKPEAVHWVDNIHPNPK